MTDETIEVPVTRTARVALVGRANYVMLSGFRLDGITDPAAVLGPLCKFVVRPFDDRGCPFRRGIATVAAIRGQHVCADFTAIPAFCAGDYVYLVED